MPSAWPALSLGLRYGIYQNSAAALDAACALRINNADVHPGAGEGVRAHQARSASTHNEDIDTRFSCRHYSGKCTKILSEAMRELASLYMSIKKYYTL